LATAPTARIFQIDVLSEMETPDAETPDVNEGVGKERCGISNKKKNA